MYFLLLTTICLCRLFKDESKIDPIKANPDITGNNDKITYASGPQDKDKSSTTVEPVKETKDHKKELKDHKTELKDHKTEAKDKEIEDKKPEEVKKIQDNNKDAILLTHSTFETPTARAVDTRFKNILLKNNKKLEEMVIIINDMIKSNHTIIEEMGKGKENQTERIDYRIIEVQDNKNE